MTTSGQSPFRDYFPSNSTSLINTILEDTADEDDPIVFVKSIGNGKRIYATTSLYYNPSSGSLTSTVLRTFAIYFKSLIGQTKWDIVGTDDLFIRHYNNSVPPSLTGTQLGVSNTGLVVAAGTNAGLRLSDRTDNSNYWDTFSTAGTLTNQYNGTTKKTLTNGGFMTLSGSNTGLRLSDRINNTNYWDTFSTAGPLYLNYNGTEYFSFDNTALTLISPSAGNGAQLVFEDRTTRTNKWRIFSVAGTLTSQYNDVTKMSLTNAGLLSLTSAKLSFPQSASLDAALSIINGTGGSGAGAVIDFFTYAEVARQAGARIACLDNGAFGGDLVFYTKTNVSASAPVERMRLLGGSGGITITGNLTTSLTTSSRYITLSQFADASFRVEARVSGGQGWSIFNNAGILSYQGDSNPVTFTQYTNGYGYTYRQSSTATEGIYDWFSNWGELTVEHQK